MNDIDDIKDLENLAADPNGSNFAIHNTRMKQICDKITDNFLDLIVAKDKKSFQQQTRALFKKPKLIAEALKRKYKSNELISRFLYYNYPSQESLEALAEPVELFLQRIYLHYGANWEKEIAKKAVREESRKLYLLKGALRENAIKEIRLFYNKFLNLTKQDIERFVEPAIKRFNTRSKDPKIQKTIENFITILSHK